MCFFIGEEVLLRYPVEEVDGRDPAHRRPRGDDGGPREGEDEEEAGHGLGDDQVYPRRVFPCAGMRASWKTEVNPYGYVSWVLA